MSAAAPSSRLAGFHALSMVERRHILQRDWNLDADDLHCLEQGLSLEQGDQLTENVVGLFGLPLSLATNFRIDDRDYLIPMVIEEPSVVAAASKAARMARAGGGFYTMSTGNIMIGQIQFVDVPQPRVAQQRLLRAKPDLLRQIPVSRSVAGAGGGPVDLEVRYLPSTDVGPMLIVHLLYDVADAMGANVLNTALEFLAPLAEQVIGVPSIMSILSNLADQRLATAHVLYPWYTLERARTEARKHLQAIVCADALARIDPYRATTHNKGILNGIEAITLATGNDWRAAAAGAHAWASRSGSYAGLTRWTEIVPDQPLPAPWSDRAWDADPRPALHGTLTLPLALGTAGGAMRAHPSARTALKLLGTPKARRLATVACAVGLAQNFAALYALTGEGIQRGHMRMHARQVALAADIPPEAVAEVTQRMVAANTIDTQGALSIWKQMNAGDSSHDPV